MKTLNLDNYGVQEMNAVEMSEMDGGIWQFLVGAIIGGMIYHYIDDTAGCNKAMSEGFNKGSQVF